jgi:hypothetical protein
MLDEVLETDIAFTTRRIWWVAECCYREGIRPTRAALKLKANLQNYKDSPQLAIFEQIVDKALETLFG